MIFIDGQSGPTIELYGGAKTVAEPRALPRHLQHVDFSMNEKISGYLSDLKRLTHLGWTPLGRSGWALGVCWVSWSAWLKHLFSKSPALLRGHGCGTLRSFQTD